MFPKGKSQTIQYRTGTQLNQLASQLFYLHAHISCFSFFRNYLFSAKSKRLLAACAAGLGILQQANIRHVDFSGFAFCSLLLCTSYLLTTTCSIHAQSCLTTVSKNNYFQIEKTVNNKQKKSKYIDCSYSDIEPFSDLAITKLSELTDQCCFAGHHMIFIQLATE